MKGPILALLTFSLTLGVLAGCRTDAPGEAGQEPVALKHTPTYSPYVLKVTSEAVPFDQISFKDVGLSVSSHESEVLYETLAESLALEIERASLASHPEVLYSEEITDPANHTACGGRHVYIDVWTTEAPPQWGYSLWSGCAEEDRFQWRQLPRDPLQSADPAAGLIPLARDIASSLRHATHTGCFQRQC